MSSSTVQNVLSTCEIFRLKWKAPSENSIDFNLVLRFPPDRNALGKADYYAKPLFGLQIYMGDVRGKAKYEPYDEMHVEDDEWER